LANGINLLSSEQIVRRQMSSLASWKYCVSNPEHGICQALDMNANPRIQPLVSLSSGSAASIA
jgi:hypothetical protein